MLIGVNTVTVETPRAFHQGYYYSFDGGLTWDGGNSLPGANYACDPAVAFNADGVAFFNYLDMSGYGLVQVTWSRDGGQIWAAESTATIPNTGSPDKNHMAIDINPDSPYENYIYVAYTDLINFGNAPSPVMFSRSINGGRTFSNPDTISGNTVVRDTAFAQGVNLAVGPNGELYAAWAVYDTWYTDYDEDALGFNKSLNGGVTWAGADTIPNLNVQGIRPWLKTGDNKIRVNSFPSMTVDPNTGDIYVVWADKRYGDPDILLTKSTDSGETWLVPPVRINDDSLGNGKDQWFPWIGVDENGAISVVFYDSRNDPSNLLTEVWVAHSLDGGQTFKNFCVSDTAFTPAHIPGTASGYQGDYIGLAYLKGHVYPGWADNRTGIYQAYFADMDFTKSGPLTSDETWDYYVLVTGDVTVGRNRTLTIEPAWPAGTWVEFATTDDQKSGDDTTKCELIVSYGTLNAIGTETRPIYFTSFASLPWKGDWGRIKFFGTSSQLENCRIEWAHKGISCFMCSVNVSETVITNCDYGAYVTASSGISTKLSLSEVTCENCSYGIRVQNGKAKLWNSNFEDNDIGIGYFSAEHYFPGGLQRQADIKSCDVKYNTKGIFVDDCSPIINHCRIDSNSLWGIKCVNDSDPILGRDTLMYNGEGSKVMNFTGPMKSGNPPQEHKGGLSCLGTSCPIVCTGAVSGPYVRGRNVIVDNNGRGVYCGGQSNPNLGKTQFPNLSPGLNSLGDNVGYDVCNTTGSTVYAQANWWGEYPPDTSEIYGPVNTFNPLDSPPSKGPDPWGNSRFAVSDSRIRGAGGFGVEDQSSDSTGTADEYNELGTYCLLNLMYDQAIEAYQYVLTNFSDCPQANYALDHLIQCYREGGYEAQITSYLVNLSSSTTNQELKRLALFLTISQLGREGRHGQAMSQCQTLLTLECDDEMERSLRFREAMLYRYGLGDDESAIVAFQRFMDKYPEDPLSYLAQVELEILGVSSPPKTEPGAPAAKPIMPLPKTFVLHQNYPNPFNAQTCVEYELPKEAQVCLRIYNILGQRVKTLADDFQPAGRYQLTWDGRNNQGIRVGSGIYFIRMEAESYTQTKKIVLVR